MDDAQVPENIHPEFHRMMDRGAKEALLGQRGLVVWLYGLSGSGNPERTPRPTSARTTRPGLDGVVAAE